MTPVRRSGRPEKLQADQMKMRLFVLSVPEGDTELTDHIWPQDFVTSNEKMVAELSSFIPICQ